MPEYLKLLKLSVDNIKKTGNSFDIAFEIPPSLPWFNGHFPQQAVLPAVITSEISDALIQKVLEIEPKMVVVAKFKGPILPDTKLVVTVLEPIGDSVTMVWKSATDEDPNQYLAELKFRI